MFRDRSLEAVARLRAAFDAMRYAFVSVAGDVARLGAELMRLDRIVRRIDALTGDDLRLADRVLQESEDEAEEVLQRLHRLRLLCDELELRWPDILDFARQIREVGRRTWVAALDDAIVTLEGLEAERRESARARSRTTEEDLDRLRGLRGPFLVQRVLQGGRAQSLVLDDVQEVAALAEQYRRSGGGERLQIYELRESGPARRVIEVVGTTRSDGLYAVNPPDPSMHPNCRCEPISFPSVPVVRIRLADEVDLLTWGLSRPGVVACSRSGGLYAYEAGDDPEAAREAGRAFGEFTRSRLSRPALDAIEDREEFDARFRHGFGFVLELRAGARGAGSYVVDSGEAAEAIGRRLVDDPHDPATAFRIGLVTRLCAERLRLPHWPSEIAMGQPGPFVVRLHGAPEYEADEESVRTIICTTLSGAHRLGVRLCRDPNHPARTYSVSHPEQEDRVIGVAENSAEPGEEVSVVRPPPPSDLSSLEQVQREYQARRREREAEGLPPPLDAPNPKLPTYKGN